MRDNNKIPDAIFVITLCISSGISVNKSYATYIRWMQADVFIKRNGIPYLGQVWPGSVYFPDFVNPEGRAF